MVNIWYISFSPIFSWRVTLISGSSYVRCVINIWLLLSPLLILYSTLLAGIASHTHIEHLSNYRYKRAYKHILGGMWKPVKYGKAMTFYLHGCPTTKWNRLFSQLRYLYKTICSPFVLSELQRQYRWRWFGFHMTVKENESTIVTG